MEQPIITGPTVETWKPVVEWEELYSVSNRGRVRSEDRVIQTSAGYSQKVRGKVLRGHPIKSGHLQVTLNRAGYRKSLLIHRLVLAAFVGPCPQGMEGCHWDDNPTNNDLSNLRWGTDSENCFDSVRNGGHAQARKTHCPQGHPLESPNLVLGHLKNGKRSCLACARARSYINAVRPDMKTELQKLADSYYESLATN